MLPLDTIICGDNCEVLAAFPESCIDLVVTSPPYDGLREYGGHKWDFYGIAWHLRRVLKPGGVIVWVVADATTEGSESGNSFRQAIHFQTIGMNIHDTMIWKKTNPIPLTHNRYEQQFEFMFIFSKGKPKTWNPLKIPALNAGEPMEWGKRRALEGGAARRAREESEVVITNDEKTRFNIWEYPVGGGDVKHPAVFPEQLVEDHIASWSNEGDAVLDPFNGSGTTTKVAYEFRRHYIGIDVNERYCALARKRLEQKYLYSLEDTA